MMNKRPFLIHHSAFIVHHFPVLPGRNLSGRALADALSQQLNTVYVTLSRVYRTLSACMKQDSDRGVAYE